MIACFVSARLDLGRAFKSCFSPNSITRADLIWKLFHRSRTSFIYPVHFYPVSVQFYKFCLLDNSSTTINPSRIRRSLKHTIHLQYSLRNTQPRRNPTDIMSQSPQICRRKVTISILKGRSLGNNLIMQTWFRKCIIRI